MNNKNSKNDRQRTAELKNMLAMLQNYLNIIEEFSTRNVDMMHKIERVAKEITHALNNQKKTKR